MSEPMRPEDVPADLVRIATEGLPGCEVRGILANAIPEIVQRVRERIADNVEVAPVCEADRPFMELLARSIRGEDVSNLVAPRRELLRKLTQEAVDAGSYGDPGEDTR